MRLPWGSFAHGSRSPDSDATTQAAALCRSASACCNSSSSRWSQVWRDRTVSRPDVMSERRSAASFSTRCSASAMARPLSTVRKVLADAEEVFGVVPRGADERDAAGEGLERADRRDARQRLGVGPTGHVDRHTVSGERLGDEVVGQVAAVVDTRVGEGGPCFVGVSHAVDGGGEAELFHRLDEELVQFGGAFVVAPVADPDEVAVGLDLWHRAEDVGVGGLVPGEGGAVVVVGVPPADDVAEGEHAVVVGQVEGPHVGRGGDAAVVRVVEQQQAVAAVLSAPLNRGRCRACAWPRAATTAGSVHSWTRTRSASARASAGVERRGVVGDAVQVGVSREVGVACGGAVVGLKVAGGSNCRRARGPATVDAAALWRREARPRRKCALPWFQSDRSEWQKRASFTLRLPRRRRPGRTPGGGTGGGSRAPSRRRCSGPPAAAPVRSAPRPGVAT